MGARAAVLIGAVLVSACTFGRDGGMEPDGVTAPGVRAGPGGVAPRIVGDRLMAAGEPELALAAYIRAVGADGPSPELDLAMAGANIRLGRLGQAERLLRDVVRRRPDDARAWNDLGVVLVEGGRAGEAVGAFRRASEAAPENVTIAGNLRMAVETLEAMRYDEAGQAAILIRRPDGTFGLTGTRE